MAGIFDRLESEIEASERAERAGAAELQDLSNDLYDILTMILERGEMSLTEIVNELEVELSEARVLLDTLVEKGHLIVHEVEGELRYRASSARKRAGDVSLDVWESLGDKVE